jgi:hypothetical protein
VQYDFFHSHYEDYMDIYPIDKIFEEDSSFAKASGKASLPLSINSSFLNGCIRISTPQAHATKLSDGSL